MDLTIRISGNVLEISPDGKTPLPQVCKDLLEPALKYKYRKVLRGKEAFDHTGARRGMVMEERRLYDYDAYGRMVTGAGFLNKVEDLLTAAGHKATCLDLNPPHPNPNRFDTDWDNVFREMSFRPRQEEVLVAVASCERGIVSAATGFGKTFLFKAICLLFRNARIVITTKRVDVMNSIRRDLTSSIPNVGQVGGGKREMNRVTLVSADSLHRIESDDVDILIGEEAHELAADSYYKELCRFRRCRMYGFSATPTGRLDNADMRLESLFGRVVVCGESPCSGMVDVQRARWGLWRNQRRNAVIAEAVRTFPADEQVLIMVTTFEHAVHLRQHLPEFTLCYAERGDSDDFERYKNAGMLPADEPVMTPQRRAKLREDFAAGKLRRVIATDVWSTGVSFNSLAVLVRADARGSEIMDAQIPGRVCRLDQKTGKQEGLVIDCLDQFDPGYREAARKRRKNYEAKGWIQEMPGYGGLL
jgi:Type III restriction enzyme, res subunit/Helicase conserved C-terminal domain